VAVSAKMLSKPLIKARRCWLNSYVSNARLLLEPSKLEGYGEIREKFHKIGGNNLTEDIAVTLSDCDRQIRLEFPILEMVYNKNVLNAVRTSENYLNSIAKAKKIMDATDEILFVAENMAKLVPVVNEKMKDEQ
jgi:hypothetical protein